MSILLDYKPHIQELKKGYNTFNSNYPNLGAILKPLINNLTNLTLMFFDVNKKSTTLNLQNDLLLQNSKSEIQKLLLESAEFGQQENHLINQNLVAASKETKKIEENKISLLAQTSQINQSIANLNNQSDGELKSFNTNYLRESSIIADNISSTRIDTKKIIDASSANLVDIIAQNKDKFQAEMINNQNQLDQLQSQLTTETNRLAQLKNESSTNYDATYLKLKSDYFATTSTFNNEVKINNEQLAKDLNDIRIEHADLLSPIKKELIDLEARYDKVISDITNDHTAQIKLALDEYKKLETKHTDEKARLQSELQSYSNTEHSQLATFVEQQTQHRNLVNKHIKERTQGLDYQNQAKFKKEYHDLIQQQNRVIAKKEHSIRKRVRAKSVTHYHKLLKLEKDFVYTISNWRHNYLMITKTRDYSFLSTADLKSEKIKEQNLKINLITAKRDIHLDNKQIASFIKLHDKEKTIENTALAHEKEIALLNSKDLLNQISFECANKKANLEFDLQATSNNYQKQKLIDNHQLDVTSLSTTVTLQAQLANLIKDFNIDKLNIKELQAQTTNKLNQNKVRFKTELEQNKLDGDKTLTREKSHALNSHIMQTFEAEQAGYKRILTSLENLLKCESEYLNSTIVFAKHQVSYHNNEFNVFTTFTKIAIIAKQVYQVLLALENINKMAVSKDALTAFLALIQATLYEYRTLAKEVIVELNQQYKTYIDAALDQHHKFNLGIQSAELDVKKTQITSTLNAQKQLLTQNIATLEETIRQGHQKSATIASELEELGKNNQDLNDKKSANDLLIDLKSQQINVRETNRKNEALLRKLNHQKQTIDQKIQTISRKYADKLVNLKKGHRKGSNVFTKHYQNFLDNSNNFLNYLNDYFAKFSSFVEHLNQEKYPTQKLFKQILPKIHSNFQNFIEKMKKGENFTLKLILENHRLIFARHQKDCEILKVKFNQAKLSHTANQNAHLANLKHLKDKYQIGVSSYEKDFKDSLQRKNAAIIKNYTKIITQLEKSITEMDHKILSLEAKSLREQKLIGDNLVGVLKQLQVDYANNQVKLKNQYLNQSAAINKQLEVVKKTLKDADQSKARRDRKSLLVYQTSIKEAKQKHDDQYKSYQNKLAANQAKLIKVEYSYESNHKKLKADLAKSTLQRNRQIKLDDKQIKKAEKKKAIAAYRIIKKDRNYKAKFLKV